jgi:hypothetical protein
MATYFRHIGAKVGIYSTASQWNPIVGTVQPSDRDGYSAMPLGLS